jgi:uncharacterized protein DUF3999
MRMRYLFVTLALTAMCSAWAAFDIEGWTWERPVEVNGTAPGFVRLPLDAQAFDEAQTSLHDLRVLDPAGNLVPHVIHWKSTEETTTLKWRQVTLINSVFEPETHSRVTLDFGGAVRKNVIRATLSDTNFRRRVSLEGSPDNVQWQLVVEDKWLFDIHQEGEAFVMDTIRFPVNDFRYLRLTIHYMEDDPRRVSINKAECALREVVAKQTLVPVPVNSWSNEVDEETGETVLSVDLGFKNLPLALLDLEIEDAHFYRGYAVRGRNAVVESVRKRTELGWDEVERDAPWRSMRRGVLFRVHDEGKIDERTDIERLAGAYRYVEMRIENGDNAPLDITGIEIYRRDASVVFESDGNGPYRLIGGNIKASAPRYDLARSMVGVAAGELPIIEAAAPTRLASIEKPAPWTERNAVIIWIALIVAVGAMVVLVVKSLRGVSVS